jgi:putative peptidoglycan lipid II flippase
VTDGPGGAPEPRPQLFRTALRLLPLQVVFRGGEAALPLLLAAWLGRSAQTDLYYVLAAYFVFATALLTAAFQDSAVVPVLIEVHAREPGRFGAVAGSLLGHTLAAGLLLAVVLGSLAVGVASRFGLPVYATHLIALMAFGLVATGVRAFYVGVLNARGVFHAHPVASGVGMGISLALLFGQRASLDVRMVPVAVLAGELVAIGILAFISTRALGVRLVPNLTRPEPVVRIFRLVRLEALGQLVTRINPLMDQLMAGMAGVVGGGTLLRYAGDVASLPTSLLQATLLPVFLTRVAREADNPRELLATTQRTLLSVVALLLALSGIFAALRGPICRALFLHGAMDAGGVDAMAAILPWALLGVAPFGALLVLARAHVARQNSRIMPSMGILNSALNAGLNLLFVRWLGLPGIALSTSVTYLVVAVVFWVRLRALDAAPRGAA